MIYNRTSERSLLNRHRSRAKPCVLETAPPHDPGRLVREGTIKKDVEAGDLPSCN